MLIWGQIFAFAYDRVMARTEAAGLSQHRATLLRAATGRVLELGAGTGANLCFYRDDIAELVLTEPEEPMARRLKLKLSALRIPTTYICAPAEQLPLADESFDCVVSTLVLCTVQEPARALTEVRRVLKSPGRLLFIEHVRSEDPKRARWQDRLHRPWAWLGNGCKCNRRTIEMIRSSGFTLCELHQDELPKAPPVVRPLVIGIAERK